MWWTYVADIAGLLVLAILVVLFIIGWGSYCRTNGN